MEKPSESYFYPSCTKMQTPTLSLLGVAVRLLDSPSGPPTCPSLGPSSSWRNPVLGFLWRVLFPAPWAYPESIPPSVAPEFILGAAPTSLVDSLIPSSFPTSDYESAPWKSPAASSWMNSCKQLKFKLIFSSTKNSPILGQVGFSSNTFIHFSSRSCG